MADGGTPDNIIQFPANDLPIEEEIHQPKTEATSPAFKILWDAADLIEGDRNDQHGPREKCHKAIAELWSWWIGIQIDAHDVAMMMSLLKHARIKTGGYNRDCYVDACGYMSIAGELRKPE